jgi:hypothetical protein
MTTSDQRCDTIKPGIVLEDGTTYYPSGIEWIFAFAVVGCQWAIDEMPRARENYLRAEIAKHLGEGI